MITGQNLRDLYSKKNNENLIRTKDLLETGFISVDITKLLEQGKITRAKRGYYKIVPFNKLIGNDLKIISDIELARIYAKKKGKEIIPSHADIEFIGDNYKKLRSVSVILLDPLEQEKRHIIHYLVKCYPDMVSFSINANDPTKKHIVLKYTPIPQEYIDFKEVIRQANIAYYNNDYNTSIRLFKQVLHCGHTKPSLYAKLGFSYLKTGKLNTAIKYLTIAKFLSEETKQAYDYTNLIESLKAKLNRKKDDQIKLTDFNDNYNFYGIENVKELVDYIIDNNLNVIEACQNIGLTSEQIEIVKLIFAREYYSIGQYEKGDQFLKAYERSSEKTPLTKSIAQEIVQNKRFYQNRQTENPLKLSLILKP